MKQPRGRQAGFTLVELMVVVIIIGVLAAVAIPSFRAYSYRSKASEATTFLGEIKQRQEAYRAEFGRYAQVSGNALAGLANTNPAAIPGDRAMSWPASPGWQQLGAAPDGPTRFAYSVVAGPPGASPGLGFDGSDFWFVSQARGDLNGDGTTVFFEGYSASNHIYCSSTRGWE